MTRQLHQDAQALRDYVTALDTRQYELLPEGVAAVTVSHSNLAAKHIDIRLDLHLTVAQVKERLYRHCGTPAANQRLFRTEDGKMVKSVCFEV
jgi:tubulin-folding cofactor B